MSKPRQICLRPFIFCVFGVFMGLVTLSPSDKVNAAPGLVFSPPKPPKDLAAIYGIVYDISGNGFPGAKVVIESTRTGEIIAKTTSRRSPDPRDNGSYAVNCLPPDRSLSIYATYAGITSGVMRVTLTAGKAKNVPLNIRRPRDPRD